MVLGMPIQRLRLLLLHSCLQLDEISPSNPFPPCWGRASPVHRRCVCNDVLVSFCAFWVLQLRLLEVITAVVRTGAGLTQ